MVRQVKRFLCLALLLTLLTCSAGAASAATHSVYDGNPSNTYIQYFRDILSGVPLGDHYVCFRSDQYTYTMVTGDLDYSSGLFSGDDLTVYLFETNNSYNSSYSYTVSSLDTFSLSPGDKIIYSDLGSFPQLEERGSKYEILTTILVSIACVCFVIRCIFYYRKR